MNVRCIYPTLVLLFAASAPQGTVLFLNSAIASPKENTLRVQSPSPPPAPNPKPVDSTTPPRTLNPTARYCQNSQQILTGLMPANVTSLTTSAYPTLLFYVPEGAEAIRNIEFSINTEDGERVGEIVRLRLTNTPGIISVSLPKLPNNELEVGKTYSWYFNFSCAGLTSRRTRPIEVSGKIKRVSRTPQLARTIADGQPDIWFDAIALVFQQRLVTPEDTILTERWSNLLQIIGEENLVQQPLLGAASLKEKVD